MKRYITRGNVGPVPVIIRWRGWWPYVIEIGHLSPTKLTRSERVLMVAMQLVTIVASVKGVMWV